MEAFYRAYQDVYWLAIGNLVCVKKYVDICNTDL